ncbi:MAG TPA: SLBB domain-containing protein [Fibrobacteria bacterium]|nr:SLBB domain-containing protein [Fibrobacteria bacterium]
MNRRILTVLLGAVSFAWSASNYGSMPSLGGAEIPSSQRPTFVDSSILDAPSSRPASERQRAQKSDESVAPFQQMVKGLGNRLELFGMDFFRDPATTYAPLDQVAPPVDYRISVGDVLDVKVWGAVTMLQRVLVDGSGQIFLPQVGPIPVAGIRFGDLDRHLQGAIGKQFRNFEVQTSLARQKSMQVYVTGAVNSPGAYTVSGFSSLVNALLVSGGPTNQGSLRQLELRRAGKLVGTLDLYALLIDGDKSKDFSLQSGDVIHIPSARGQVAIVNGVLKPAIYEIKSGETLNDLVRWAGGFSMGTDVRQVRRERLAGDSGLKVDQFLLPDSGRSCLLGDGEIFEFARTIPKFENAVTLRGHARQTGRFPWKPGMKIRDLLPQVADLIPDQFWNRLNGFDEGANLATVSMERRLDLNWEYAMIQRMSGDSLKVEVIPFSLGEAMRDPASKENLLLESGDVVTVFGASDLSVPVRFRPMYVKLDGEVQRGGLYKVRYGETLKDVLQRAGGLTPQAYLFGAKFLRASTKAIQKVNYREVVDEMERQFEGSVSAILASATSTEESRVLQNQVNAQRTRFEELKRFEPEGRLVLELKEDEDLGIDAIPEIPLEDGDVFSIPPMPSTISVFGEVSRQTAFLYRPGRDVGDYLSSAGGPSKYADKSQAFVIRADGTLVGEQDYGFLFWQLSSMSVLPGDAIVMPRKLEATRWVAQLKDWTQILANFGLSAAALASLTK